MKNASSRRKHRSHTESSPKWRRGRINHSKRTGYEGRYTSLKDPGIYKTTIHTSEKQKKEKIYTHEQYEDLVLNGDEDVGGSGTPREGEPALGAMRFVQFEVG